MNIDSNAATAILSSSEMSSNIAIQNRKSSQSKTSFKEQLQSTSKEDSQEVSEQAEIEEDEAKTEKATKTKNTEKADKKATKERNAEAKTSNNQNTQTVQQNGEITFNANPDNESFTMLSDQVKNYILQNGGQFNLDNININLMNASTRAEIANTQPQVDYTSIQMSDNDAMFFSNLVKNTDMSMQSVASEFQKALSDTSVQQAQSSAKASAALISALQDSAKTNQPFRIDFDKDISVILKVDKEGKINANFIPGDKAVEAYLRNNIDILRQRFNEENIAYGDLNYSKSRQERDEKEQQHKKEQENE